MEEIREKAVRSCISGDYGQFSFLVWLFPVWKICGVGGGLFSWVNGVIVNRKVHDVGYADICQGCAANPRNTC